MEIKTSYNLDFLNNYFTSDEFAFINNAKLENEKLDTTIVKELHNRDFTVNFINNLNSLDINIEDSDLSSLLSEVQEIFNKINDNIKFLKELRDDSSKILDDIMNLLINVENNQNNKDNYFEQIQNLKDMINSFSIKSNEINSQIILNDINIDNFYRKDIVKKYLSSFDAEFNLKNNSNLVKQDDSSLPDETTLLSDNNSLNTSNITQNEDLKDNDTLLISEKLKKVFLPFSKHEISLYLEQYPDSYNSFEDVINKEFVVSLDYYMRHPVIARFREAYSLIRDRESKSVIDAFKFSVDIMFRYSLNPAIIAACKTQEQLEHYINCLDKNKLDDFNDFKIKFEINPIAYAK